MKACVIFQVCRWDWVETHTDRTGTGKTESVKALGGLFGRQVLVFNCDEVKLIHVVVCYTYVTAVIFVFF